jgi:hypothetical protein
LILILVGSGARRPLGLAHGDLSGHGKVETLEPSGLSVPGWAHDPENSREDRLVVGGKVHPVDRLAAVITALDVVQPLDLPHVRAEDREFVAAEMTAFLRSWLQTLACPVLDRPTTLALSGAAGDPAVWSKAAASLAVADGPATPVPGMRTHSVTVVAGKVVGPAPEPAASTALALAQSAGVTAARLTFADDGHEPILCRAVPWWHTPSPLALRTLLAYARGCS